MNTTQQVTIILHDGRGYTELFTRSEIAEALTAISEGKGTIEIASASGFTTHIAARWIVKLEIQHRKDKDGN